ITTRRTVAGISLAGAVLTTVTELLFPERLAVFQELNRSELVLFARFVQFLTQVLCDAVELLRALEVRTEPVIFLLPGLQVRVKITLTTLALVRIIRVLTLPLIGVFLFFLTLFLLVIQPALFRLRQSDLLEEFRFLINVSVLAGSLQLFLESVDSTLR